MAESVGAVLVSGFHMLALFAIGATIVWSAAAAFLDMAAKGHASDEDLLMLFMYLELGAMVGIYFVTNRMPVRFLIYVAITALTRLLIGMVNYEHLDMESAIHTPHLGLVVVIGGIVLLAISLLLLRYASYKYPSERPAASGVTAGGDDLA